jgi:hypothetical protein
MKSIKINHIMQISPITPIFQISFIMFALIISLISPITIHAEELTISGNGSTSDNTVQTSSDNTTNVAQNNDTTISNDVQVSTNTGGNTANDNTNGNTSINTGNTQTIIDVTNTANSNATTSNNCCAPTGTQATVSGNGSNSDNNIAVNNSTTTNVSTTNNATITNTISGTANTGNNRSNNNTSGNITITTGSIGVYQQITNGPINVNNVVIPANAGTQEDSKAIISGNGSYSTNNISLINSQFSILSSHNTANILNEQLWILNTGGNGASNNTNGDVSIATGGIKFIADIINGPININTVKVDCKCISQPEKENPTGGVTPSTPATTTTTTTESKTTENPGRGGEVLGIAVSKILPATGNYSFLFIIFGNALLLLLGVVLRLHSGRSPAAQIAL